MRVCYLVLFLTQRVFLKSHDVRRDPANCDRFGDAVIPPGH